MSSHRSSTARLGVVLATTVLAVLTAVELGPYLRPAGGGGYTLDLPAARLEALVTMATACPDRRFRGEAMWGLQVVAALGTGTAAATARRTLETLVRSTDPIIAAGARAFQAHAIGPDDITSMLDQMKK